MLTLTASLYFFPFYLHLLSVFMLSLLVNQINLVYSMTIGIYYILIGQKVLETNIYFPLFSFVPIIIVSKRMFRI
jgi:hypothetical protein